MPLYNLHGSAFWKVEPYDKGSLPNPEIVFLGYPYLPINKEHIGVQVEKGKTLYPTNIITGYQKAQKTTLTPFRQMVSSFDKDCCSAKKVYIIGYSFGDEHINESIKTGLRYNEKLQLEIVDPNFISNNLDKKLLNTIFQFIEKEELSPTKKKERVYSYFNDRVIVYTMKFNEYLICKND